MPSLAEALEEIKSRVEQMGPALKTEEATKHALVLPFLSALGYDVFNPMEVVPEFIADVGEAKGEKVDYAVFSGKNIAMLVECKTHGSTLDVKKATQLLRYFNTRDAKVGVLTNGDQYQFYTDLDKPNVMDPVPFLDVHLSTLSPTDADELGKFCKGTFDIDDVLSAASELRYTKEIKAAISAQWDNPSDDYVRFFVSDIYNGRMTERVRDQFRAIVRRSVQSLLQEKIEERLKIAAMPTQAPIEEEVDIEVPGRYSRPESVFTEDEQMGLNIVRAIVATDVDPMRVVERDFQSYCNILLDDNRNRRICRFYFSENKKSVGLIGSDGQEYGVEVTQVSDLYAHADAIRSRTRQLAGPV